MAKKKKLILRFYEPEHLEQFAERLLGDPKGLDFGKYKEVTKIELYPDVKPDIKTRTLAVVEKDTDESWKDEWVPHWTNINDYNQDNKEFYATIDIFLNEGYKLQDFADIVEQNLTQQTKSIYYPKVEVGVNTAKRYTSDRNQNRYPIYVISKGRAKACTTAEQLHKMGLKFKVVVEPQEVDAYCESFDYIDNFREEYILPLDMTYKRKFDTYIKDFDYDNQSTGSGPTRNFVWDHAQAAGHKWHWIMDDNIFDFWYLNNNMRTKAVDGGLFAATEDWCDRYDNIGISGLNYYMFASHMGRRPPYNSNAKIYSCILIRNDIPLRWGGRYNEDVDLCLRALKEGYATVQMNAFLANKAATQQVAGGNTEAFYSEEGTLPKAKMLEDNHPDVCTTTWKFGRWHHQVDYSPYWDFRVRTMVETIRDMCQPQIISKDETDIIKEIMSLDFKSDMKFDGLFKDLSTIRRDKLIEGIKFYRYLRDPKEVIKHLIRPQILDYVDNEWLMVELTEQQKLDEKIVDVLLDLVKDTDGVLKYETDWDKVLDFVEPKKRAMIKLECERNKYLLHKEFPTYDYGWHILDMTKDEHLEKRDSKAEVYKKYLGRDIGPIPVTLTDKFIRGELKKEKQSFTKRIVGETTKIEKEEGHSILITGDQKFEDKVWFDQKLDTLLSEKKFDAIVNGTCKGIDNLAASWTLGKKGIKCVDFKPNHTANTVYAIRENNKRMVEYCDEAIIFISKKDKDYDGVIEELENSGKPYQVVNYDRTSSSVEDW